MYEFQWNCAISVSIDKQSSFFGIVPYLPRISKFLIVFLLAPYLNTFVISQILKKLSTEKNQIYCLMRMNMKINVPMMF